MYQNPKCKKLLSNMYNLSLSAINLSEDLSPVKISDEEKYIIVCQGAIATACLMYRIISDNQKKFDIQITTKVNTEGNKESIDVIDIDYQKKFPPKYERLLSNFRKMSYAIRLPEVTIDKNFVSLCAKSFDDFKDWFMAELDGVDPLLIDGEMKSQLLESDFSLATVVSQPRRVTAAERYLRDLKAIRDFELAFKQDSEMQSQAFFQEFSELVNRANFDKESLSAAIDMLFVKVSELNDNIKNLQNFVAEQLKNIDDDEKEEKVIEDFTNQYVQYITSELSDTRSCPIYDIEEKDLKGLFELSAWNKLDCESQNFLVTARVTYKQLVLDSPELDYSGVCVLVSKALEVELAKRFFYEYLDYLAIKYDGPDKFSHYPKTMLNNRGDDVFPEEKFTFGSVYYVLYGYRTSRSLNQTQKNYIEAELVEYCKDTLFSGKSDDEILDLLKDYAEKVNRVKDRYRNPSCHKDALVWADARACFDYVIDIYKILKEMLDSFDH